MSLFQIKKVVAAVTISAVLALAVISCKKDNFTVPPPGANLDPAGIHATMTISQFKQRYCTPYENSYFPVQLHDSVIISGIVNADDRSGNFYKTLSLQDSTGGIQIKIGSSYLYQDYPIGRRIFIKVKGLYFYNYSGTYELGGYIDSTTSTYPNVGAIVSTSASDYVIKGQWGLDSLIKPVHKTIRDLNNADFINLQSTLVEVDNVEFGAFDTTQTYADALTKASVNRNLYDCASNSVIVRTSGFAGFANTKPNKGHGSLVGVYSYYSIQSVVQLAIRDTTDVLFSDTIPRCH
jgi:hypothetical protein